MTQVQKVTMWVAVVLVGLFVGWWIVAAAQSNADGHANDWRECVERVARGSDERC